MPDPEKDYTLTIETKTEVDKKIEAQEVPVYFERLELEESDKTRLQKEIWDEWDEIKGERDEEQVESLWDALDRQYDGKLNEDKARQFNIDRGTTQIKVDKIASLIMQSLVESEPKFSVTPRPEYARQGGIEVCAKQEDFLDDRLDNLPSFEESEELTAHSTVLKGTGLEKIVHLIKREERRREERYTPKLTPVLKEDGSPQIDPQTNQPIIKNTGLEEFLKNWPQAPKDYPGLVKKLLEGKEISVIANYTETTYNDPYYKNINLKDFYCRLSTEGYEGLKSTKLTVERMPMSWWELEQEQKRNNFYDIDKLKYDYDKKNEKNKEKENYKNDTYNILECVYYGKIKDADEDVVKMVLWFDEESKTNIGAIMYPYYAVDCYYVPHYIMKKKAGFYQPGIGQRLTGDSIASNAILNFTLEGAWLANSVTPITKDPDVIDQFLEKRFAQGVPLIADKNSIDFLNKYMQPVDVGGLMNLLQYINMGVDDKSGVSSLMSGRESPVDPTAPAQKTMALLQQSGLNIRGFQNRYAPAINEIAYITLALYFQMSKEGRKYRARPERVVGSNPFAEISRMEMSARTNIQTMSTSYDFDKANLKQEAVALYTILRQEPLIAKNPEAVQLLLKTIIVNWGQLWKNLQDKILPTIPEIKKASAMAALQGVDMYVKQKQAEAQVTGIPMQLDIKQLLPLISDLVAQVATAPSPEAIKQAEKNSGQ